MDRKLYYKEWAKNNRDKLKKAWTKYNRSKKKKDCAKRYYENNKVKILLAGAEWRKKNPDKVKLYTKKWKIRNPDKVKAIQKNYQLKHGLEKGRKYRSKNWYKKLAQAAVARAVKYRKLKRLPCLICGEKKSQAHHPDYSKRLEVLWLCQRHHVMEHSKV